MENKFDFERAWCDLMVIKRMINDLREFRECLEENNGSDD